MPETEDAESPVTVAPVTLRVCPEATVKPAFALTRPDVVRAPVLVVPVNVGPAKGAYVPEMPDTEDAERPVTVAPVTVNVCPDATVKPAFAVTNPEAVRVLFVRVSVPSRVAKVWFPVGKVTVPLLDMVEMTGAVRVLFVRV